MYTRYTWRLCLSHIEVDLNPQGVLAEDPAQHLLWHLAKQLRLPTAGVQARLTLVNIFFFPCSSLWLSLSLSLQLFLRLSKQRSLLFRRMLRSVSWKLPARSDQRIVLQFFAFLPKHRGEEYKPSFQQHQRQRLRKLLLWRKPQNLKVTTILCQVRTHISYENWTAKFYDLVSNQILWYLIKDLISIFWEFEA